MTRLPSTRLAIVGATIVLAIAPGLVTAGHYSGWGPAVPEVGINSPQGDGCPIESPNGKQLFIASNRPGTVGDPDMNDIWVAQRQSVRSPWSAPVNLGMPVNSAFADFCPTPLNGNRLLFVSARPGPQACGVAPAGDIYFTKRDRKGRWAEPVHLGCDAAGTGPNFSGPEFGPSLVKTKRGTFLYFSSNGNDGGDQDIYVSRQRRDGTFGPAKVVAELSTAFDDFMPNISANGREMVFNSNRPGGYGGQDVYTSRRKSTSHPWSAPVNVGPNVNTAGNETRSSLSGDGRRLHFGRDGDIYVSVRTKVHSH